MPRAGMLPASQTQASSPKLPRWRRSCAAIPIFTLFMRETEWRSAPRAKTLRRRMTHAEVLVWMYINKLDTGFHFRRQHPIGPYIADFACVAARLVVEVDGLTHGTEQELAHDRRRDAYLRRQDWRIIRVTNDDVYTSLNGVMDAITDALHQA